MKRFIKYLLFCATFFTGFVATQNAHATFQETIILDDTGEIWVIVSKTGVILYASEPLDDVISKWGLEIRVLNFDGAVVMTDFTYDPIHELFFTSLTSGEYVLEMKTNGYFKEFMVQI